MGRAGNNQFSSAKFLISETKLVTILCPLHSPLSPPLKSEFSLGKYPKNRVMSPLEMMLDEEDDIFSKIDGPCSNQWMSFDLR